MQCKGRLGHAPASLASVPVFWLESPLVLTSLSHAMSVQWECLALLPAQALKVDRAGNADAGVHCLLAHNQRLPS